MKIYLVVDDYQYDGGFVIEAAYLNSNEALIEQQRLRRECVAHHRNHNLRLRDSRLESIRIEELEVK